VTFKTCGNEKRGKTPGAVAAKFRQLRQAKYVQLPAVAAQQKVCTGSGSCVAAAASCRQLPRSKKSMYAAQDKSNLKTNLKKCFIIYFYLIIVKLIINAKKY
jgi:hypothetical protein